MENINTSAPKEENDFISDIKIKTAIKKFPIINDIMNGDAVETLEKDASGLLQVIADIRRGDVETATKCGAETRVRIKQPTPAPPMLPPDKLADCILTLYDISSEIDSILIRLETFYD